MHSSGSGTYREEIITEKAKSPPLILMDARNAHQKN